MIFEHLNEKLFDFMVGNYKIKYWFLLLLHSQDFENKIVEHVIRMFIQSSLTE